MNKFVSEIHHLNNYNIRFSRIDINNDLMINRLEIFDKILNHHLVDIKMDFTSTKALNRYLQGMLNCTINSFVLDIPSYNTIEVCRIEGRLISPFNAELIFRFQNTNNNISGIKILLIGYDDFATFVNHFFFYLLIDLVQDIDEE